MKKITALLLSILFANAMQAQSPDWIWAKAMGGISGDYGNSVAVDASGNVYTTGTFTDTVDFDPGAGVFNLTGGGGFISKLDSSGKFVWAIVLFGITNNYGNSIAIDTAGSGDVYITGSFYGTADFDPGAGVFNLTAVASSDIFISKLDSSGNFVWAKAIGGTSSDHCSSIAIDPAGSGEVYTTGNFLGTVDFDPGAGTFNLTSASTFASDIFISKLDSSGNFIWAKAMGGTIDDVGHSIAIDTAGSGNVYTTGSFEGTADFDPDTSAGNVFNLTSAGIRDMFISKLDGSGNFVWAKRIGGTGMDIGKSIAINPTGSGDVYTLGGGFISKLDSSGNFIWAKAMEGGGRSIALDPAGSGDVYTTGFFYGTADFDPGAGVFNLTSVGGLGDQDIFISKLNSSGNFVWAKAMGGTSLDYVESIALDASGMVHVTGYFLSSTITFGSTILTNPGSLGGTADIYTAKLDTTTIMTGNNDVSASLNMIDIFPNPLSGSTVISFSLTQSKKVSFKIFDVNGRLVSTLATQVFDAGENEIIWNASEVNAGIYFLRMETASYSENLKLIVAK